MKWTNTIEAVKRGERHQWAIGDALLTDAKDARIQDTDKPPFSECHSKLKALG